MILHPYFILVKDIYFDLQTKAKFESMSPHSLNLQTNRSFESMTDHAYCISILVAKHKFDSMTRDAYCI
jgi:hypothetical protein